MIRISKWSGLVTAASPYILPAGGSTEQVNAQSTIPGQLTVRGGMTAVSSSANGQEQSAANPLTEVWGYSTGPSQGDRLFAFTDNGQLLVFQNLLFNNTTTLPGAPTILDSHYDGSFFVYTLWSAPSSDGGSAITQYRLYYNGGSVPRATVSPSLPQGNPGGEASFIAGTEERPTGTQVVRVSAVNAVGEGPLSAPFVVEV